MINIWKDDEIKILIDNYEQYGPKYCSKLINRSKKSCILKAKKLNIKFKRNQRYKYDTLKIIVKNSKSKTECLKKLKLRHKCAGNYKTLDKYIKLYNLDISHFTIGFEKGNKNLSFKNKIKIEDILIKNSTYNTNNLKERLYAEGFKKRECEICGQGEEWNGKHMSLILDHKNGIPDDHQLENLRIVCPNCNATLETHCRGAKKLKNMKNKKSKHKDYCECGNIKWKSSKNCLSCHNIKRLLHERPSYEQLLKDINETNYSATGRKYGVSDNSIRKWIKKYEKTASIPSA